MEAGVSTYFGRYVLMLEELLRCRVAIFEEAGGKQVWCATDDKCACN
jgi:hypothetical protein